MANYSLSRITIYLENRLLLRFSLVNRQYRTVQYHLMLTAPPYQTEEAAEALACSSEIARQGHALGDKPRMRFGEHCTTGAACTFC